MSDHDLATAHPLTSGPSADGRRRQLDGFNAVVTGASSGIGLEVARALAMAGAAVAINYRAHGEAAQRLVEEIERQGGRAVAIQADVASEEDVLALFARTREVFGRLDLVVANAGIQKDARFEAMTLADWQAVLDVNLTGQFLCCREAVRAFRSQDGGGRPARAIGSIICMSSVHDLIPWTGHVNYAASKGGLKLLVQSLAQEVAEHRIRVNAIAPGAIRTPINKEAWDTDEALQRLLQLVPYGRIGEPEDVAKAVVWLASDEADYVTGATLYVDGGMTLYPEFRKGG